MAARIATPAKSQRLERVTLAMNVVLALTGVAAVAALLMEYGFDEPPLARRTLHLLETIIVAVFVLDRLVRLLLAPRKGEYLRSNWVDFALIGLAGLVLVIASQFRGGVLSAGALYLAITQVYILISLILRAASVNLLFAESGIHPTWLLAGSFAFLCLAGSGLLMLPAAVHADYRANWFYDDALFTAVSATCVTGLVVRDTGTHFTLFGQAVVLGLIQLGGLGIMMFGTVLAMMVGKGLSVRTSSALGQMMATERIGEIGRTLKFVIIVTLVMEAIGAATFFPMFSAVLDGHGRAMTTGRAVWHSVFHSVSAFCNAGFALYGKNTMQGVQEGWSRPIREHWQILGVMAPLIVLGGLGFPVLQDLGRWAWSRRKWLVRPLARVARRPFSRAAGQALTLHTRIVLVTSGVLIVLGAAGLIAVEKLPRERRVRIGRQEIHPEERRLDMTALRNLRGGELVREAVFQSVTARTAGFNTVDMDGLSNAGKLWLCGLMVIGGSPASTAGGMKTSTFVLLLLATYCLLRLRSEPEVFRRSIPAEVLGRAQAVALLYLCLVAVVTLLLSVGMKEHKFVDLLFEACSACGTVGLSSGITTKLEPFGKYVVIGGMFIGRVGPLTLLLGLTSRLRRVRYAYPKEEVVIG